MDKKYTLKVNSIVSLEDNRFLNNFVYWSVDNYIGDRTISGDCCGDGDLVWDWNFLSQNWKFSLISRILWLLTILNWYLVIYLLLQLNLFDVGSGYQIETFLLIGYNLLNQELLDIVEQLFDSEVICGVMNHHLLVGEGFAVCRWLFNVWA